MTIKTIFRKIHINPLFYIFGLLSILAGLFKAFIIMYLIVFIHELGHIVMALIFNYEIVKINIYPFGGYTIFNYDINTSFIKEFMVFIGGILFQIILFILFKNNNTYTYELFNNYNTTILIFNMIPVVPLDGSKVLNILLNKLFPFKLSHLLSIYISYIFLIILILLFYKNINMILMVILLVTLVIKEHKNHLYLFNRFLLERYIKNLKFRKNKFITNNKLEYMDKYKNNIFIINNKYLTEKDILRKKYEIS